MAENDVDPWSRLPTWRLVAMFLASASAAISALYLLGAVLAGWPGAPVAIVVFCAGGVATALLKPPRVARE